MSLSVDFATFNVEITSSTFLGVTICNVFVLDFPYTGIVFVLISNAFDWVWLV